MLFLTHFTLDPEEFGLDRAFRSPVAMSASLRWLTEAAEPGKLVSICCYGRIVLLENDRYDCFSIYHVDVICPAGRSLMF